LGHRVPRAGQLRKWEGPPTNNPDDAFDTLARTDTEDEGHRDLQSDAVPQTLNLIKLVNGLPHPIFRGKDLTLNIFPDHLHEGQLVIPKKLDESWPPFEEKDQHKKPRPIFVAKGCDKRSCKSRPVLGVYDGDPLGVGRIVADSSFHHYTNVNLKGFRAASTTSLDLLGQLFQNLALYLAPRSKRVEMAKEMTKWLVQHPAVQEERGNPPAIVGQVALDRLSQICTGYEMAELGRLAFFPNTDEDGGLRLLSLEAGVAPSHELIVGSIISRVYRDASARLSSEGAPKSVISEFADRNEEDTIAAGIEDALIVHRDSLKKKISEIPELRLMIVDTAKEI
jgi:hypothetical protein